MNIAVKLKLGTETHAQERTTKPLFTKDVQKEKEDSSITSEESLSTTISSLTSPDEHIIIEELSGNQNKYEIRAMKRRNWELEREVKRLEKKMIESETNKLEMLNRCNFFEAQIAKSARNANLLQQLRTEFTRMHQKKAEVEADFMNQLHTLSMVMRQKELNHERILSERDDMIFFLKSKLAAYKIVELGKERINNPHENLFTDADYQKRNEDLPEGNASQQKASVTYLTSALEQSREKNKALSNEIHILQDLVNQLEVKGSKVTRLESELEDCRTTLATFRRANSLLSNLDKEDEKDLCDDLLNSSREEEEFMNQLQTLESDMTADLEDLQASFKNLVN